MYSQKERSEYNYNITVDFTELGCKCVNWIELALDSDQF
jgi:hypothetical protein